MRGTTGTVKTRPENKGKFPEKILVPKVRGNETRYVLLQHPIMLIKALLNLVQTFLRMLQRAGTSG